MTPAPPQPKILVVDDDAGLLRLIARALRREGFTAAIAASSTEVEQQLAQGPFTLMLVDLRLQETTGPELVAHLAARGLSIPFVVITGQGDERVAVDMMKQGALDYLVKDHDFLEAMPMRVRRAVENVQQRQRLREAENALKREHAFISVILNTAGAVVIVLDAADRILRFNRAAELVTGYPAAEVIGAPFIETLIAEDDRPASRAVHRRVRQGERQVQRQGKLLTKGGTIRLIAWSSTQLMGDAGEPGFIIRTGIDITERHRLEEQILEISGREQRRIGQDLHDGLGQHLTGIELMTQYLEQTLAAKKRPEAEQAAKISKHVREAIRQSKSLARGLSPVELDRHGLMSALQELAASTAEVRGITCTFECPVPLHVEDNPVATQLYRIAQEALNNALKHGRARHIVLRLSAAAGGKGSLAVRDDGSGFDARHESSGMGLEIMQYRASAIGATLDISSRPGTGTVVTCLFPHSSS